LKIETYFQQIQEIVEDSPLVLLSEVNFEKRGGYEGFIRGDLLFEDGSILHFREFIDTEVEPDRMMYAYQYLSSEKELIFRYDNSPHHKKLQLPTYPHHKHEGEENHVIPANPPDLHQILELITEMNS